MKYCHTCETEKDESEFHQDLSRPDGLYARCKLCRATGKKSRRYTPGNKALQYDYSKDAPTWMLLTTKRFGSELKSAIRRYKKSSWQREKRSKSRDQSFTATGNI